MKKIIYLLLVFCLQVFASCNSKKVKEVGLFFYKENKLDSVKINDKKVTQIFNRFMLEKKEVYYKFPTEYFVKILYTDGTLEEYDGNKALLRANVVYTVDNLELKNEYLKIINSVISSSGTSTKQ